MTPLMLRCVFDTNTVVSAVLFSRSVPTMYWLRRLAFAAGAVAVIGCSSGEGAVSTRVDTSDTDKIARGAVVYQQNCASCHGANLEGQPNWVQRNADGTLPAPPHDATGHTWHHSDELLFELTKWGSAAVIGNDYRSNMPGFSNTLDDDDIWAVLTYIESQWPEEIRAARNAR